MLELLFGDDGVDTIDRDAMPVTAELLDNLRDIVMDPNNVNGPVDVEAVLFQLVKSVIHLESQLVRARASVINLERRILEAGLPVRADE